MIETLPNVLKSIEDEFRNWRNKIVKQVFQSRLGRKIAWHLLPNDVTTITQLCGDHFLSYHPHDLIGRRIFVSGQFCRTETVETLDKIQRLGILTGSRRTIIEIGANIGTQSVYFALDQRVERVIAIEPEPGNLELLRRNVSQNNFIEKIEISPVGISNIEGELELFISPSNSGAASFHNSGTDKLSVRVKTMPLSVVLEEQKAKYDEIALIWMDVEGFEPEIFQSVLPILYAGAGLYMEFSPQFYGKRKTAEFVEKLALVFKTAEILGKRNVWTTLPISSLITENRQVNLLLKC